MRKVVVVQTACQMLCILQHNKPQWHYVATLKQIYRMVHILPYIAWGDTAQMAYERCSKTTKEDFLYIA